MNHVTIDARLRLCFPKSFSLLASSLLWTFLTLLSLPLGARASSLTSFVEEKGTAAFSLLGIKEGLSQTWVSSLVMDQNGNIWVGTQDGLNRYDGRFRVFRHDPQQPSSLAANFVGGLELDGKGILWVANKGQIVQRFDPAQEQFVSYPLPEHSAPDMVKYIRASSAGGVFIAGQNNSAYFLEAGHDTILTLIPPMVSSKGVNILRLPLIWLQDQNGQHWVANKEQGISIFGPDGNLRRRIAYSKSEGSLPPGPVIELFQRRDGTIWVLQASGLFRYEEARDRFSLVVPRERIRPREPQIRSGFLYEDKQGRLWLMGEREIFLVENNGVLDTLSAPSLSNESDPEITSMAETSSGELWAMSGSVRLFLVDEVSRQLREYTPCSPLQLQAPGFNVNKLLVDRNDNFWIGTPLGLAKVKRTRDIFFSLNSFSEGLDPLISPGVWTVLMSQNGTIWAGISNGTIKEITPQGTVLTHKLPSLPKPVEIFTWIGPFEDEEGNLWAIFRSGFISRFVVGERRWHVPPMEIRGDVDSLILPPEEVTGFTRPGYPLVTDEYVSMNREDTIPEVPHRAFQDGDHTIWVASSYGLWHLDPKQRVVERIPLRHGGKPIEKGTVRNVARINSDELLIGTEQALLIYNQKKKEARELSFTSDEGDNLPLYDPMSLTVVDGQVAWMGSGGDGLFRLDLRTLKFKNFTVSDGLPNSTVYAAIPDAAGRLWLPTNRGLARFNPTSGEVITFTEADGLQGNEFNEGAWSVASDGQILLGGVAGITRFRPERTDRMVARPQARIQRFTKKDELIPIDGLLKMDPHLSPASVPELTLGWKDQLFAFEFASLELTDAEQTRYRYRMNDLDSAWIQAGVDRRAFYSQLDEGDYTFEVQAAGRDGKFVEPGARLRLKKDPPPWRTWWAYLLYLGLGLLVLRLWSRAQSLKLEQARALNEQLTRVDHLKDEFLANTSHELRTPLNGIIGLAESLLDGISGPLSQDAEHNLRMIIASGRRLGSLVNDLLDFSRLKNRDLQLSLRRVTLRSVVDLTLALLRPLVGQKQVSFCQEIAEDLPDVHADENRLVQIFQNLIGNAIKFTESGTIRVSAYREGSRIIVEVSDTGIGIPEDKWETIFKSFEQVDGSISRAYGGTGLGLAITRQLVQLHGGTISVHSVPGSGSTFRFDLPCFNADEHDKDSSPSAMKTGMQPQAHAISALLPSASARRDRLMGVYTDREPVHTMRSPLEPRAQQYQRDGSMRDIIPVQKPARILVVDDEPVNLQVLVNHLSLMQYDISVANSGTQALQLVDSQPQFDLIILDVMMPRLSGLEVCRRLRERWSPGELPVIMLTARNQVGDLVEGFDAGASDYLTKPVNKHELLARTRTHLQLGRINHAYARFVPREFLQHLELDSILDVKLGDHVKKQMTVLFSDIRSFTALSEKMTPEENFRFVNAYLERMEPVIRRHGGFIDKYIGDAIMALFDDEPADAVRAAIDMMDTLREYNEGRARAGYDPIQIGIGLNTGELMLGTVGGPERMDGTVISDAVNLASRMEGLTKLYESAILISDETRSRLSPELGIGLRLMDRVRVKGRSEPVRIYEVMDGEAQTVRELRLKSLSLWTGGQALYERGDFSGAKEAFAACLRVDGHDGGARLYVERCQHMISSGHSGAWDGVTVMESK